MKARPEMHTFPGSPGEPAEGPFAHPGCDNTNFFFNESSEMFAK